VLGFRLMSDDNYALVFDANGRAKDAPAVVARDHKTCGQRQRQSRRLSYNWAK